MSTELLPSVNERRRVASPDVTPQALAWHKNAFWMGTRDSRRIYAIDPVSWKVFHETEAPGIPWAAVSTGEDLCFTLGEGDADDRYLWRYSSDGGFTGAGRVTCPEFTGSFLSYDGSNVYLSQWHKHRILKLDSSGNILQTFDIGAEICGHTFYDGAIYLLRGTEQGNEDWRIARLDLETPGAPQIEDLAKVPFQCRSLAFDGSNFWSNHRVANEIVCFALPG
jgi:hypothetical protein